MRPGSNCVGAWLGNGRYYGPRFVAQRKRSYGFPKLLLQLRIEQADGRVTEVLSDESWRLTTDGPIRANSEFDGEKYDARREQENWSKHGFVDARWQAARVVSAPGGVLSAQMIDPIRVTGSLPPVGLTEPRPGVYVFDFGQNMVGWCRLRVRGMAGTVVTLRHAETLQPDGMLYVANLRSAKVTDTYTLKGGVLEVWEPRFTYHGFRYVELTGLPGRPDLATLEGRMVNDDLASGGSFACSHPLLNRIYTNILWGVRGNYRSIPTDCPQRDERQGWLGDRAIGSHGETYLFRTAAFYAKWMQDIADAQLENGNIPDVAPPFWNRYSDNVTWPSTFLIIPGTLYRQYGDRQVVARMYPAMVRWIELLRGSLKDDVSLSDKYGDWCVPPEEPGLIHSKDPARKTAPGLLATSYFYHCLQLMEQYALLLGNAGDAHRWRELGARIETTFHREFFRSDVGYYDNGSQTSCILPLAFKLTPPEQRPRVFDRLVDKITAETNHHVGTGLIGGQWLMRTLSDHGRADLAYTLATQRTYPSLGYMVDQGATTLWELWNGDTADPAMNSMNHVMLSGDLVIWLFEYLAGIRADPAASGFKHILLRPHVVGDLKWVQAKHDSPYGLRLLPPRTGRVLNPVPALRKADKLLGTLSSDHFGGHSGLQCECRIDRLSVHIFLGDESRLVTR